MVWLSAVDLWRDTVTTGKPFKFCVAAPTGHSMPAPNCTGPVAASVLIWAMSALSPIPWNRRAVHRSGHPGFVLTVKLVGNSGQANAAETTT